MRIGIITWFTGPNYGTNLQAIALQFYLRKQGHEVQIINYTVETQYTTDHRTFWQKVASQPEKYAYKYAMQIFGDAVSERNKKMEEAVQKKCILTEKISTEEQLIKICNSFDLLICGSDQIWNPNWYHRFYFADYNAIKTRRISYAPSLGVNSISDKIKPEITQSISKFDAISVREGNAAELLMRYTTIKPAIVVDPTFLLRADDWRSIFHEIQKDKQDRGYVFSMFLTDNPNHWKAAMSFAKGSGLRHVIVPYRGFSYFQSGEIHANAGLGDLLCLIQNARYVLTDSFHIMVFSIIYQKQFYTFQRFRENEFTSQNVRVSDLLKRVGLENRLLPFGCKQVDDLKNIDYEEPTMKLEREITNSKQFLMNAIEGKTYGKSDCNCCNL